MSSTCELVNTYQVLEHVMGINGLHPHRLDTVRNMRRKLIQHVKNQPSLSEGVVLDIGCGSGAGTSELAEMFDNEQRAIGIDINAHAIDKAKSDFSHQKNLSFFQGDLADLLAKHPELKISAVICISVSMFIHDVENFYKNIYQALLDGGIFIDAPFLFSNHTNTISDQFRYQTYSVCGCNMTMFQSSQLYQSIKNVGFTDVKYIEHDFDLMKLPILFQDYSPIYLLKNFYQNIIFPPEHFGKVSSNYLFKRTLQILIFFLKHRKKYSGGEFMAIKS